MPTRDANSKAARLSVFICLWASFSRAEMAPWFWRRDILSDRGWPCGSVVRPNGGAEPEVFHFRLNESPSESLWRDGNELAPLHQVGGECAVVVVAPTLSSRLALRVDSLSVAGGVQQCLAANALSLYDLGGGRLLLKDTICGPQKMGAEMHTTGNLALITINLGDIQKGSFILTASVLHGGNQHTTTPAAFIPPPTTPKPAQYQELTTIGQERPSTSDVFLVPLGTLKPPFQQEVTSGQPATATNMPLASMSPVTMPPVTMPPVTLPPVTMPPITVPPVTMPFVTTEVSPPSVAQETSPQNTETTGEVQPTTTEIPVSSGFTESLSPLTETQSGMSPIPNPLPGSPTETDDLDGPLMESSTIGTILPSERPYESGETNGGNSDNENTTVPLETSTSVNTTDPTSRPGGSGIQFVIPGGLHPSLQTEEPTRSAPESVTTPTIGFQGDPEVTESEEESTLGNTAVPSKFSTERTTINPPKRPGGSGIQFVFPIGSAAALVSERPFQFPPRPPTTPSPEEDSVTQTPKLSTAMTNSATMPADSGIVFVFSEVIAAAPQSEESILSTLQPDTPSDLVEEFTVSRPSSSALTDSKWAVEATILEDDANPENINGGISAVSSQDSADSTATNPTARPEGSGIAFVFPEQYTETLVNEEAVPSTPWTVIPTSAKDFTTHNPEWRQSTTPKETSETTTGEEDENTENSSWPSMEMTTSTPSRRPAGSGTEYFVPVGHTTALQSGTPNDFTLWTTTPTSVDDLTTQQLEWSPPTTFKEAAETTYAEKGTTIVEYDTDEENADVNSQGSMETSTTNPTRKPGESGIVFVIPKEFVAANRSKEPSLLTLRSANSTATADEFTRLLPAASNITISEGTSKKRNGEGDANIGDVLVRKQTLPRHTSTAATTTYAPRRDVWSGIQFVIPKESLALVRRKLPPQLDLTSTTVAAPMEGFSNSLPETSGLSFGYGVPVSTEGEEDAKKGSIYLDNAIAPLEIPTPAIAIDISREALGSTIATKSTTTLRKVIPASEIHPTSTEDLTGIYSESLTSTNPDGDEETSEGSAYTDDTTRFPFSPVPATAMAGNVTASRTVFPKEFAVDLRRKQPVRHFLRSATNPVLDSDLSTVSAVDLSTYNTVIYEDFAATTQFPETMSGNLAGERKENSDTMTTEGIIAKEYTTLSAILSNGGTMKLGKE